MNRRAQLEALALSEAVLHGRREDFDALLDGADTRMLALQFAMLFIGEVTYRLGREAAREAIESWIARLRNGWLYQEVHGVHDGQGQAE